MKETPLRSMLLLLLSALYFISPAQAVDCFGWSVTKRVSYLEVLPLLLYYDQVNWINLDPNRTCTFRTTEAVFLQLYSANLTASYQEYRSENFQCKLSTQPAQTFVNASWLYANDIFSTDSQVCAYYITVQNKNTRMAQMFQVIRTGAEALRNSVVAVTAIAASVLYISFNL